MHGKVHQVVGGLVEVGGDIKDKKGRNGTVVEQGVAAAEGAPGSMEGSAFVRMGGSAANENPLSLREQKTLIGKAEAPGTAPDPDDFMAGNSVGVRYRILLWGFSECIQSKGERHERVFIDFGKHTMQHPCSVYNKFLLTGRKGYNIIVAEREGSVKTPPVKQKKEEIRMRRQEPWKS